jgi:hypothetical protein
MHCRHQSRSMHQATPNTPRPKSRLKVPEWNTLQLNQWGGGDYRDASLRPFNLRNAIGTFSGPSHNHTRPMPTHVLFHPPHTKVQLYSHPALFFSYRFPGVVPYSGFAPARP